LINPAIHGEYTSRRVASAPTLNEQAHHRCAV
jgi:hypothetical protein